jgi:hypothetical protein
LHFFIALLQICNSLELEVRRRRYATPRPEAMFGPAGPVRVIHAALVALLGKDVGGVSFTTDPAAQSGAGVRIKGPSSSVWQPRNSVSQNEKRPR